jgi:plastocyanin
MHTVALQLAPILGAEKSKVPFYIAGGLLVAWALLVSVGLGMRRPDFPGSLAGQRAVMAITAVLVLAAVSTAVITSGSPAKSATAGSTSQQTSITAESPPLPAASTPATSTAGAQPTATTGTPTPSSSPAARGAGSSVSIAANPGGALSYNTKQLSAKAGTVTITMTNMSPVEHNVTVAQGTTVLGATPTFTGGSRTLKVTLKPGRYTFYCSVPGHRAAGMEGTLTVS